MINMRSRRSKIPITNKEGTGKEIKEGFEVRQSFENGHVHLGLRREMRHGVRSSTHFIHIKFDRMTKASGEKVPAWC